MKQKLTLLFLFLAAGISMAHAIDFERFGKENPDHIGNINYRVKNTCHPDEDQHLVVRRATMCSKARDTEQTAPFVPAFQDDNMREVVAFQDDKYGERGKQNR